MFLEASTSGPKTEKRWWCGLWGLSMRVSWAESDASKVIDDVKGRNFHGIHGPIVSVICVLFSGFSMLDS
ncbi:hypothetical protein L484_010679 [Morus notabilis]|uniref:Uncharacterized protein n=1 Tax=Morus notabilis TaxID=981085 RepID=W9S7R5_9ROSA|nr:hypothetical protein L484_010679 [Morus notabilis]